ncbi:MAG: ABC transporter permease [Bulleidia sp.]
MEEKIPFWQKAWFWLNVVFFYMPIFYVIFFSFNRSKSLTRFTGFSMRWYEKMFASRPLMEAIGYTLACALLATLIATIVGTITAIGLSKSRRTLRDAILQVNNIPMLNPDIVTAIGFMLLFTSLRVETGFFTMLLAHIAFCIPYVMLSVLPRLHAMDSNMAEAAMDLGCTPAQALIKVIIPQIKPGMIAGALVAFSMSFDDFVISLFTTGPGVSNISMYVYANVKRVNPTINALSAILVVLITIVLTMVNLLPLWHQKHMKKEVRS